MDKVFVLDDKFVAEKDKSGIYIYKATDKLFKTNTLILKKKYADLPRFKVIIEYEKDFKKQCDKFLINLTKDLVKKLKQQVK